MTQDRDFRFLAAYAKVRKVLLLKLELPYEVPQLDDPERIGSHYRAVIDAYNVLSDLPGDDHTKFLIGELLLEFLTGIEMYRRYNREGSAWYGDAADKMLASFEATLAVLDYQE
ncbi:hypothetical protein IU501_22990 [Nocardia otitidiscaviarum]|uniref:hypothetical protein n=1 Tax=Nocardia otitidiscaviarum TaxID=1823 RepID=UPI0004A6E529|nr:hypothetical protein [Nocardia otitidiscaviarum]MBF6135861.1 hypothetical protein [Nocardia otitidiscaviarum]